MSDVEMQLMLINVAWLFVDENSTCVTISEQGNSEKWLERSRIQKDCYRSSSDIALYQTLAEVPGVARENLLLHAWHFGKRLSYDLL